MTKSLRDARITLTLAALCTTSGIYFAVHTSWLCIFGFYGAAFFTWCATRFYTDHRRTLAEHEWAKRVAAGEMPPPLDPCCRLARHSGGAAHDHRCTRDRTDETFAEIIARLDLDQPDDPRSSAA